MKATALTISLIREAPRHVLGPKPNASPGCCWCPALLGEKVSAIEPKMVGSRAAPAKYIHMSQPFGMSVSGVLVIEVEGKVMSWVVRRIIPTTGGDRRSVSWMMELRGFSAEAEPWRELIVEETDAVTSTGTRM